jgi:PAS domain S-box-containing protein
MCGNRARGASRPPDGEAIRLLCVDGEGEGRGLADRLMRADDRFEVVTDRSASRALAILAGEPPDQRRRSSCATPAAVGPPGAAERPEGAPGSVGQSPPFDCVVCGEPADADSSTFRDLVGEQYPSLPFVRVVSGGEVAAAAAIDDGATDVVRSDAAPPVVAARIANAVGQARAARQRARADRLEALLGRADGSISVVDPAGVVRYHSPSIRRHLGYEPAELEGETLASYVHPDDRGPVRDAFDAVRERGGSRTVRYRFRHADGSWHRIEAVVADGTDEAAIEGVVVTRRDVTGRFARDRERELEAAERRFEAVFENPVSLVALLEPDGTVVDVNRTALELVDATAEEVSGTPFPETPWWNHSPAADELGSWIDRAAGGEPVRFSAVHRLSSGDRIPVDGVLHPIRDDDGEVVSLLAAGRDVSERVEREQVLATLHEAASEVTACETVAAACRLTVEAAETVLDMDLCSVLLYEDGWLVPEALSSGAPADGVRRMAPDQGIAGRTFQSGESSVVDDLSDHPDVDPAKSSYRSGISVPVDDLGVFQAVSTERGAFDGSDVEFVELLVAHTARTIERLRSEAELRRRQAELERHNERLAEFAGVVSHDLRNPMAVAAGRIDLAREECGSDHLEVAASALDRMGRIVDEVLTIARDGGVVEETEPVGLGEQVRTAWGHVDTGSADLVVESDLPFAADPDRLQHVLENLIRNAIEHGGDGVTVRVGRLDGSRDGPGDAEWNGRGDAGRDVEPGEATGSEAGFYVEDDGPGLPPGQADGAFEPGETSGEASGLGLRIVGRMVDAHGWGVTLTESRTGGARFEVTGVVTLDD